MNIKLALVGLATILALVMYVPLFHRILTRKSTRDFSKPTQWMILIVQLVNLALAMIENAWYLSGLYVMHTMLVGVTLWLVYKYYGPPTVG